MANPDNNKMIEQEVAGIMHNFGFSTEEPTFAETRVEIILKDLLMSRRHLVRRLQEMRSQADAVSDLDNQSKQNRWSEGKKLVDKMARIDMVVNVVDLVFNPKRTNIDLGNTRYHFLFPESNSVETAREEELGLLHSPRKFIDGLLQKLPKLGEQK